MEVFFTGLACLFNGELKFRSLNRRLLLHCKSVMHTLSDCVAGTVLHLTLCPVWLRWLIPCLLVDLLLTDYQVSPVVYWKIKRRHTTLTPSRKISFRGFKIASVRLSSEWVKQNNTSPMTVQQRCWLGLITVKVNCASVPVVVLVHVAASKQLLT